MAYAPRKPITRVIAFIVRTVFRLLGGYRASGMENIPATGGCILAPNHLSWADPPSIGLSVPRDCWFMANDFLFRVPVLGFYMRNAGAFPVRRGTTDREAIRKAEEVLQAGDLLCVFPEGGTTITGRQVPFEGGVALLALRNNVPVVPVAITGSDRVLPRRNSYPRYARGGITATFGKPIHPDEIDPTLPKRERMDRLTERLYDTIASMLPPEYAPPPDQVKLASQWDKTGLPEG
jgi:1-acyl-sn-glycerol-3-phosphate acyltransferase